MPGCLIRLLLGSFFLLVIGLVGGVLVGVTLVFANWTGELDRRVATLEKVPERSLFETSRILDREGEVLWEIFGEGKRTRVPIEQISEHLLLATIAVEDDTFYENSGVDIPSLLAAIYGAVRDPLGRPAGGSTITQQLVRHLVFDYEERTSISIDRKAKEIVLAWIMGRNYSKDKILEMYLNEVNYGNLAYGIEAAANTYFGKSATELNLAEASLLAALPQSPYGLDPYNNLEGAKARQWLVLNLMVGEGYISRLDAEVAYQEPLLFEWRDVGLRAPHFAVYVRQRVEEMFGAEMIAEGGLQVTTTLDLDYQRLAERLARQHVAELSADHDINNVSLVAMKPGTGEIVAMLGSVDYMSDEIDGRVNIALSSQQPGSTIKPILFAAALSPDEEGLPGWTTADILWDVEADYGVDPQGAMFSPINYDQQFHGPVRLRSALANSYNVPAILLLQDIGVAELMGFARGLGITTWNRDPRAYGLSLALGSAEVTPLELTTVYATFANGGRRVDPFSILRVSDKDGNVLYEHVPNPGEQVLDERVAFLITDILDDDAARIPSLGSDNPLVLPFPAAAKLGTTTDLRDVWAVGYTPGLVLSVWAGNSDNSPMKNIDGLSGAAPLWSEYLQAIYGNEQQLQTLAVNGQMPPLEFNRPRGISRRMLCALSSVVPGAAECRVNQSEWFLDVPSAVQQDTTPDLVRWEEIDPGVLRVPALRLADTQQTVGTETESAAQYCRYDEGLESALMAPEVVSQIFLVPPRNLESLVEANLWARRNGLVVLPAQPCTDGVEAVALGGLETANPATGWRIASPQTGQVVDGVVNVTGTANFQPNTNGFYFVELGIPDTEGEVAWVPVGSERTTPVINGSLIAFDASTLSPGDYFLRLSVSQNDRLVGDPYIVAIRIGSIQAAESVPAAGEAARVLETSNTQ